MNSAKDILKGFPKEATLHLNRIFGNLDRLYATIYLIARNAHQCEMEAVPGVEQRMRTISIYQGKIRFMLDEEGLNGQEIMDAIAAEYLEDFIHYREPDFGLTNEAFIDILKKVI